MKSGNAQGNSLPGIPCHKKKAGVAVFIIGNLFGMIVIFGGAAEGDNLTGQVL